MGCQTEEKTRDQIWDELCEASRFEGQFCEPEDTEVCYEEVIIPVDLYCSYPSEQSGLADCPTDLLSFEARFSTCDETEKEWPTCAWLRSEGCGTVQFEAPCDESCVKKLAFNASDGSFLGQFLASDSAIGMCNAERLRVGEFNDYHFEWMASSCPTIETHYCCDPN